jgi:hypothetical protein
MIAKCSLRASVLGAASFLAASAGLPAIAQADVMETFDVQNCSSNCGAGPFGTVLIQQNGINSLNYTVQLNSNFDFHGIGLTSFVFDIVGAPALTFSNFQFANQDEGQGFTAASAGMFATSGTTHQDGFGDFNYGVNCPTCSPSANGIDVQAISFTITSASALFAQLGTNTGDVGSHSAGSFGTVFSSASIFLDSNTATTGPVGATTAVPVPAPIIGAGLPGLVMACGWLLALARRRRQLVA